MKNYTLALRLIWITLFLSNTNVLMAQWSGSTTQATKVCTANDVQEIQMVVPNGSGGVTVAWEDFRNGGSSNRDIYIDNLSSAGTLQWSIPNSFSGITVCTATGSQFLDDLIIDVSGNIFVAWTDDRNSTDADIYVQKFNNNGIAQWVTNGVSICNAINDQTAAKIISDGAGGIMVTWEDYRNAPSAYSYVQRINSTGVALWNANGVKLFTGSSSNFPYDIIPDGGGGAIISIIDTRNSSVVNGLNTNLDIFAQKVNSSGDLQWGNNGVPICTYANNQSNYTNFIERNFNAIPDGNGGAIFYWHDYRNDPGNGSPSFRNADIYAQRLNSSGASQWAANGIIICNATTDAEDLRIISDGAGGAIAAWVEYDDQGSAFVKTARTNSSGVNQWIANGILISDSASSSVDLALDNNGGVIFTWSAYNPSGTEEIYSNRLNLANSSFSWTAGGVPVCTSGFDAFIPTLVTNIMGEAIIIWQDARNETVTDIDLYANKLNNNGILPLLWGNFTGILKGKDAIIQWETLQESNTKSFDIERSLDGISFQSIGTKQASGNSTTKQKYEITDRNILLQFAGRSLYYRIKQNDLDGKVTYSKVIRIAIPKELSYLKLLNNPVKNAANLLYISNINGGALITLTDMQGKVLYRQQLSIVQGANQFTINMEKLSSGMYFAKIEINGIKQIVEIIK